VASCEHSILIRPKAVWAWNLGNHGWKDHAFIIIGEKSVFLRLDSRDSGSGGFSFFTFRSRFSSESESEVAWSENLCGVCSEIILRPVGLIVLRHTRPNINSHGQHSIEL